MSIVEHDVAVSDASCPMHTPCRFDEVKFDQDGSEVFAYTRRFCGRCANESLESDRAGVGQVFEPVERVAVRKFDKPIPVAEHFQQPDLDWTEPLVASFRARASTDEPDAAGVAGESRNDCDGGSPWYLRRQA